jgi:hypothetical protein
MLSGINGDLLNCFAFKEVFINKLSTMIAKIFFILNDPSTVSFNLICFEKVMLLLHGVLSIHRKWQ